MEEEKGTCRKKKLDRTVQGKKCNFHCQKKIDSYAEDWTAKQLQRHETLRLRHSERARSALEKRTSINMQRQEYFQHLLRSKVSGKIAPQSSSVQGLYKPHPRNCWPLVSPQDHRCFTPIRPHSAIQQSASQPPADFPYRLSYRTMPDKAFNIQQLKLVDNRCNRRRIDYQELQKFLKPMRSIPSKRNGQFILLKGTSTSDVLPPTSLEKRLLEARFPNHEVWCSHRRYPFLTQKPETAVYVVPECPI
ncbi:uncharacterized protein LOC115089556 [Rhinatrema bivittatum]|uniref:uncharacterized protein LOC115089556 n=1 Tax=Rhinatrema bivittatum TaxID=194408 RepID=UPI00112EBAEC|nr:uncharacterized protein LOC115089556 [Rhinatrema bivittatum]XP_029453470.1 uncharacterized protein LOC115089556 [Rhinatrema bivittatum]